jgi:polyferredoxin
VDYRDPAQECINYKKCVRVCPMGIDIRNSPYQIECIHCGECVDACNDILARLGKDGLIHYAWGKSGKLSRAGRRSPGTPASAFAMRNALPFCSLPSALPWD